MRGPAPFGRSNSLRRRIIGLVPGGCAFAEAADCPAVRARLIWDAWLDASVLTVEAIPATSRNPDAFDLARFAGMATTVIGSGGSEHVVLSDGYRRIRIDVARGTLCHGPVCLGYLLEGLGGIDGRIMSLRRLVSLNRLGRFARHLYPREPRAPRWIASLRAHDALQDGAHHRDIAIALFGANMVRQNWGRGSDCLRLRVQRLVRGGHRMVNGGYQALLS